MSGEAKRAFYFGTYRQAGHYLWDESMQRASWSGHGEQFSYNWPGPWRVLDGTLQPNRDEGQAALRHRDGWTALAFANFTDDSRPNSNSAFFFEATLTFKEAMERAHELFPLVIARFDFEIRLSTPPPPTQGAKKP